MLPDTLQGQADQDDVTADLTWWLSGGVFLALWTGFALLLTSA